MRSPILFFVEKCYLKYKLPVELSITFFRQKTSQSVPSVNTEGEAEQAYLSAVEAQSEVKERIH